MPAAWVGPGCREKRVNFRRDRWLHGPDSESPTGKAGRHSRSTVAGLGEKRRLFFLYSSDWISCSGCENSRSSGEKPNFDPKPQKTRNDSSYQFPNILIMTIYHHHIPKVKYFGRAFLYLFYKNWHTCLSLHMQICSNLFPIKYPFYLISLSSASVDFF